MRVHLIILFFTYSTVTTVTGVCAPGSKGYYKWTCSGSYLYRYWYSDAYCSIYSDYESVACNTTGLDCSNYNTYAYYGYNADYYYWDTSSVSIAVGAIIGIVIAAFVGFCIIVVLCCWCTGSTSYQICGLCGYVGRSPVLVTTTTTGKPVTTTTTLQQTTVNLTTQQQPQPQFVTTTQPQYYTQQQQYMPQQQQYMQQQYVQQPQYMQQQYIQQPQYTQQQQQPQPQSNSVFMPQPMYTKQPISNYVTPSQPVVSDYSTPSAPQFNTTTFEEPGSDIEGTKT